MTVAGDVLLGQAGAEILMEPFGRRFTRSIMEDALEERTPNGRMIKDIRWRKYRFTLGYSICSGTQLSTFQLLWDLQEQLSLRWADNLRGEETYTVEMEPFDATRFTLIEDGLWRNVSIELKEV